jgi:hypothetical protein
MRFARWVFAAAGIYGIIILTPLFFSEHQVGAAFPPVITHPEYYYGFLGTALVWQFLFLLIAFNPVRYKLIMLFAAAEKFIYTAAVVILFTQGRLVSMMLSAGIIDFILGCLFIIAFFKTKEPQEGKSTDN